jgi:hypothetical protein
MIPLGVILTNVIQNSIFSGATKQNVISKVRILHYIRLAVVAACILVTFFGTRNRPQHPLNKFLIYTNKKKRKAIQILLEEKILESKKLLPEEERIINPQD